MSVHTHGPSGDVHFGWRQLRIADHRSHNGTPTSQDNFNPFSPIQRSGTPYMYEPLEDVNHDIRFRVKASA